MAAGRVPLVHFLLILVITGWDSVSGVRIKVQLSEIGIARLQDCEDKETACED